MKYEVRYLGRVFWEGNDLQEAIKATRDGYENVGGLVSVFKDNTRLFYIYKGEECFTEAGELERRM